MEPIDDDLLNSPSSSLSSSCELFSPSRKSRYGRTQKPKITQDFCSIDDVIIDEKAPEKTPPKPTPIQHGDITSPEFEIKNEFTKIDDLGMKVANNFKTNPQRGLGDMKERKFFKSSAQDAKIEPNVVDVTKVLKLITTNSPVVKDYGRPSSVKTVKTYSNRRKPLVNGVIESFGLPDQPIVPQDSVVVDFVIDRNLDVEPKTGKDVTLSDVWLKDGLCSSFCVEDFGTKYFNDNADTGLDFLFDDRIGYNSINAPANNSNLNNNIRGNNTETLKSVINNREKLKLSDENQLGGAEEIKALQAIEFRHKLLNNIHKPVLDLDPEQPESDKLTEKVTDSGMIKVEYPTKLRRSRRLSPLKSVDLTRNVTQQLDTTVDCVQIVHKITSDDSIGQPLAPKENINHNLAKDTPVKLPPQCAEKTDDARKQLIQASPSNNLVSPLGKDFEEIDKIVTSPICDKETNDQIVITDANGDVTNSVINSSKIANAECFLPEEQSTDEGNTDSSFVDLSAIDDKKINKRKHKNKKSAFRKSARWLKDGDENDMHKFALTSNKIARETVQSDYVENLVPKEHSPISSADEGTADSSITDSSATDNKRKGKSKKSQLRKSTRRLKDGDETVMHDKIDNETVKLSPVGDLLPKEHSTTSTDQDNTDSSFMDLSTIDDQQVSKRKQNKKSPLRKSRRWLKDDDVNVLHPNPEAILRNRHKFNKMQKRTTDTPNSTSNKVKVPKKIGRPRKRTVLAGKLVSMRNRHRNTTEQTQNENKPRLLRAKTNQIRYFPATKTKKTTVNEDTTDDKNTDANSEQPLAQLGKQVWKLGNWRQRKNEHAQVSKSAYEHDNIADLKDKPTELECKQDVILDNNRAEKNANRKQHKTNKFMKNSILRARLLRSKTLVKPNLLAQLEPMQKQQKQRKHTRSNVEMVAESALPPNLMDVTDEGSELELFQRPENPIVKVLHRSHLPSVDSEAHKIKKSSPDEDDIPLERRLINIRTNSSLSSNDLDSSKNEDKKNPVKVLHSSLLPSAESVSETGQVQKISADEDDIPLAQRLTIMKTNSSLSSNDLDNSNTEDKKNPVVKVLQRSLLRSVADDDDISLEERLINMKTNDLDSSLTEDDQKHSPLPNKKNRATGDVIMPVEESTEISKQSDSDDDMPLERRLSSIKKRFIESNTIKSHNHSILNTANVDNNKSPNKKAVKQLRFNDTKNCTSPNRKSSAPLNKESKLGVAEISTEHNEIEHSSLDLSTDISNPTEHTSNMESGYSADKDCSTETDDEDITPLNKRLKKRKADRSSQEKLRKQENQSQQMKDKDKKSYRMKRNQNAEIVDGAALESTQLQLNCGYSADKDGATETDDDIPLKDLFNKSHNQTRRLRSNIKTEIAADNCESKPADNVDTSFKDNQSPSKRRLKKSISLKCDSSAAPLEKIVASPDQKNNRSLDSSKQSRHNTTVINPAAYLKNMSPAQFAQLYKSSLKVVLNPLAIFGSQLPKKEPTKHNTSLNLDSSTIKTPARRRSLPQMRSYPAVQQSTPFKFQPNAESTFIETNDPPELVLMKNTSDNDENKDEVLKLDNQFKMPEQPVEYQVGDLAWARIGSFPFWPCMVTKEPLTGYHKREAFKLIYHVRFFGDNGRRAWVSRTRLMPYFGKDDLKRASEATTSKNKAHLIGAYKVPEKRQSRWNDGVEEAEFLKDKAVTKRLNYFDETYPAKRKINKEQPQVLQLKTERPNSPSEEIKKPLMTKKRIRRSQDDYSEYSLNEKRIKREELAIFGDCVQDRKSQKRKVLDCEEGDEIDDVARPKSKRLAMSMDCGTSDTDSKFSDNSSVPPTLESQAALYKRNNIFRGVLREKVCQICEKPGDVFKCKGPCNGVYHQSCACDPSEVIITEIKQENVPTKTIPEVSKVEILSLISNKPLPLPKLSSPPDFLTMTLAEKIDFRMKEIMKKLDQTMYNDPTEYPDSSSEEFIVEYETEPSKNTTALAPVDIINNSDHSKVDKRNSLPNARVAKSEVPIIKHVTADNISYVVVNREKHVKDKNKQEVIDANSLMKTQTPKELRCKWCASGSLPVCLVCHQEESPAGLKFRQKCSLHQCGKYYHPECLKVWPQTQWSLIHSTKDKQSEERYANFLCPRHVCHTCISDDPRAAKTRCSSDKLVKCLQCPSTYHSINDCVPAGSHIISSSQIVCPRHCGNLKRKSMTQIINANWCFICSNGGDLICCETCPTSVHSECLPGDFNKDDTFYCEDCQSGRMPLYDEIVWVKLGSFRWWPAIILFPNEVPDNVKNIAHNRGEFVVKFFGTYDHYWVGRGRTFLFQEGDKGHHNNTNKRVDNAFQKAIEEAAAAHHLKKQFKLSKVAEKNTSMKPPPYIRIKVNKPVGNVRQFDGNTSNTTSCNCDPNQPHPCGPDSDCLNRLLLTECNPEVCPAGKRCNNQCFEKREYPPLLPYRTEGRGWGLKTLAPVKKGQFVIEYVGEIIDEQEYQRRVEKMHEQKEENFYFLTIETNRLLDAGPKGNVARFMNHSCQPNCETQKWTVNGDTRVGLFANCDIPADMELTFNYNLECIGKEKKICRCGAPNCTGFIGVKVKSEDTHRKIRKMKKKKPAQLPDVVVDNDNPCFVCAKIGDVGACNNKICPKFYHLSCVGLNSWPDGNNKWVCPWHNCNFCSKRTIRCCVKCVNSYCPSHSENNIRYDKLLGFVCTQHDPTKESRQLVYLPNPNDDDVTSTTSERASPPRRIEEDELSKSLDVEFKSLESSVTSTPLKQPVARRDNEKVVIGDVASTSPQSKNTTEQLLPIKRMRGRPRKFPTAPGTSETKPKPVNEYNNISTVLNNSLPLVRRTRFTRDSL